MRRDFVANVSHELRTPLAIISGCLQRLQRINADNKKKENQTRIGQEEVQRISNLLDKLSILTAVDSGNYKLRRERAELLHFLQA